MPGQSRTRFAHSTRSRWSLDKGFPAFEKAFRLPSSKAFPLSVQTVTITNTVADLTGRQPTTVADFVQENASVFRG